jgi:hypothetical protein
MFGQDDKITFGTQDAIAVEETPIETFEPDTQEKMRDTLFYSTLSGSDPNGVFDYVDEIKEKQKGTRWEDWNNRLASGLAKIGTAIADLGATQGQFYIPSSGGVGLVPPKLQQRNQEITEDMAREMKNSGDFLWRLSNDPGLALQNDDLFAKATDLIAQTLPYITATTAAGVMLGPAGAFAVGSLIEGDSTYRTALDNGVDENKALILGVGGGLIKGAIEAAGFKGVEGLFEKVSEKFASKILRGGLKFTGATVVEALEEGTQELVDVGAEKTYRKVDWKEALTRTLGAMAGGAFLGGAIKGGGIAFRQALTIANEQIAPLKSEQTTDTGEPPTPDISGSVDFANRENLPEEIPDITEEEFRKALGLSEASTTSEQNQGDQTANQTVSQENGQVTQETKPTPQEAQGEVGKNIAYSEKIKDIPEGEEYNNQRYDIYRKHVEESVKDIISEIGNKYDLDMDGTVHNWGSGSSHYVSLSNNEGDTINIRLSDHDMSYGGNDLSLNAEDSAKENINLVLDYIKDETDWTQKSTPPVKENLTTKKNVNSLQDERDILGGEDPIQVLGQNLKKAKEVVPTIQAEQKVVRKERFQKMRDVANELINKQGLTPSQALNIARMELSGEQTEYNRRFESIRERLEQSSPGTVKALELTVWNSPQLQLMDKNALIVALNKLIDGHYLQKAEIKKIRDFFGDALGDIAESRIKIVPWYEQIAEIWRAGLLTGVKTSMLNEMSNFFHAVTETASDNVAAGIDAFISKITGNDRTIAATVKGEISGFMKKGVPEFKHYMKTGVDNRNIGKKYDYAERSYGNGKWAKFRQAYVNTVFHLMGAEDMLFYYAAEGRSYYNQALAQGINEGLSGKELTEYADKLATNPTEKMIEIGINDAETAVFMNKTTIGDLAAAIQNKLPVLGKVIVPFSRTPAAIGMQIINYTPVGTAKEVIQQIHQGKFDQRKFSQAVGRSIVGTAVLVIGSELLKAGLMTLGYPKGERERKLWEVEGRKPFSVKVGNKWRSVYILGPAGNILIVGGYFQQAYQETGSPTEAMTVALFGGAKSIAEQTFLRGLNQALTAVSEPEMSWNRWFSDMAGSAVPTIVADVARMTDITERRAEGPVQKIQNRLPFLREMLQPKLDIFGQDLPRYGGNPLEVMVDPTRPVKINQDIVVDELRRLWDVDIKVSPTLLGDRMGYDILTDEENTELWRNAGKYVYRGIFSLIMDSEYKILIDEDKGKAIEDVVKDAKDLARAEMAARKMSEGVTEIELRNGKLLTNDVKKLLGD